MGHRVQGSEVPVRCQGHKVLSKQCEVQHVFRAIHAAVAYLARGSDGSLRLGLPQQMGLSQVAALDEQTLPGLHFLAQHIP